MKKVMVVDLAQQKGKHRPNENKSKQQKENCHAGFEPKTQDNTKKNDPYTRHL